MVYGEIDDGGDRALVEDFVPDGAIPHVVFSPLPSHI